VIWLDSHSNVTTTIHEGKSYECLHNAFILVDQTVCVFLHFQQNQKLHIAAIGWTRDARYFRRSLWSLKQLIQLALRFFPIRCHRYSPLKKLAAAHLLLNKFSN